MIFKNASYFSRAFSHLYDCSYEVVYEGKKIILRCNYSLVNQLYCDVKCISYSNIFPHSTLVSMSILCFDILVHLHLLSANTRQFVAKCMENLAPHPKQNQNKPVSHGTDAAEQLKSHTKPLSKGGQQI